jgi:hypothetical protein
VSVAESKGDYKVRRLGLVKFQGARSVVTPLPEVHNLGRHHPCQTALCRFQDNKAIAVDEICVFPKHLVELRTIGWSSGMGSASNWPSVCSICVDVSFIALSPFGSFRRRHRQARASHPRVFNFGSLLPRRLHSDVRCSHTPSRDNGPSLRGELQVVPS